MKNPELPGHRSRPETRSETPRISVFIPAFNAERFIGHAIESVLAVTNISIEVLVIDDASEDETPTIIQSYNEDGRVRDIYHAVNKGQTKTRNEGLSLARGEYIALLDADDFCAPSRLSEQLAFLDSHPDIDVVGSWWREIDERDNPLALKRRRWSLSSKEISAFLLFRCIIHHPTVMARTRVLAAFGYNSDFTVAQDYELWSRVSRQHQLAVMPKVLLFYRRHDQQAKKTRFDESLRNKQLVQADQLRALGIVFNKNDLLYHSLLYGSHHLFLAQTGRRINLADVNWTKRWLGDLVRANSVEKVYPEREFNRVIGRFWWSACLRATFHVGLRVWAEFICSGLVRHVLNAWKHDLLAYLRKRPT